MILKVPENRADSKVLIQLFEMNEANYLMEEEKLDLNFKY
jgi:hypothetical protein